jgi:hypothetical protein
MLFERGVDEEILLSSQSDSSSELDMSASNDKKGVESQMIDPVIGDTLQSLDEAVALF